MRLFRQKTVYRGLPTSLSSAAAWAAAEPLTSPGTGAAISKIVCVEKANIERSGAVAQGLYAINCYMGMQWNENQPEDHVRYARNDLMGLVREDLGYDIARHVDSTVHKFEEWGLPIMRDPETGRYQREGKWQIMIHGESYKPIVAEAARKAATEVYNRIMVTHLLMDRPRNRVAGAVGFNVRTGDFHVFRAKAVIVCRRRCLAHLQAALGRRGHGTDLVRAMEQRVRLCFADSSRRQDDANGEPDCPDALQGRLRSGRRLFPASEDLHAERLWRGVRVEVVRRHQGSGRRLHRPAPGPDLPAQPRHPRGGRRRPRSHPHGDQGSLSGSAQGDDRLGELPRHDDRAGGRLGIAEHRSQAHQSRADHVGALCHGLARDVLRRLGERPGRLCARGISVGLQPNDDGRRPLRGRRHHWRHGPQILVGLVHRRPHRRQGGGQIRERDGPGSAAGQRSRNTRISRRPSTNRWRHYQIDRNEIVGGNRVAELHPAASTGFSVSRRSWTSMSAASASTT